MRELLERPPSLLLGLVVATSIGVTACTRVERSRVERSPQGASTARTDTIAAQAAPEKSANSRSVDSASRPVGTAGARVATGGTPGRQPVDSPAPKAQPGSAQGENLKFDANTNTVTFQLIAGPFTFNGYANGGAALSVPPKSNVVINFSQQDGTPHSAEIDSGDGPVPNSGGNPAIPRAYTNKVIEGLPQGATDVMRFTAPESGSFRIICGVPGHALSGMWIWFKVDPAAKQPSFGAAK